MPTSPTGGSERTEKIPVYILAGGLSRRFGVNKARADVDGVPMIVALAQSLEPVAHSITVVAATADAYDDLGLHTIGDDVPGRGPAGGLLTALRHAAGHDSVDGWIFVTACDWTGIDVDWVRTLLENRRDGVQAVVFQSDQLEPLFGLYHVSAGVFLATAVDTDRLRMQGILNEIPAAIVPAPGGWEHAINVNREADLRKRR